MLAIMVAVRFATAPLLSPAQSTIEYNLDPINYDSTETNDAAARLIRKIADGQLHLEWDDRHGWLPALLETLDVPRASQTLVFSKTSMQFRYITPSRPRAVYFSDDIYVGWVRHGKFVELAAVDPQQGAIFYKVEQKETEKPLIVRDQAGECLACHVSGKTQQVPGFLVRSVFAKSDGQPEFRLGTVTTNHTTPLLDRFGGWYVTGHHGAMRHRGNVTVTESRESTDHDPIDREAGANLDQLPRQVRPEAYLEPTSDIVALMLLEHQTQLHNWVTNASYETRRAIHHQQSMNRIIGHPDDYRSESTQRRILTAAEKLVDYLLFCDEFPVTSPIQGSRKFRVAFESQGIKDQQGRSLRQLDLQKRLLRYSCSYLIYSDSFQALPKPILDHVHRRLVEVLSNQDTSERYAHLSTDDRRAIFEILSDTHPLFKDHNNEDG